MKNTLLDVAQNFGKMSDSEKVEVNDNVRKQFDNIIHGNPPKTEREKEIDKLAREELEEYRRKKKAFYDKQEYKLGEHISINELAEAMFSSPALRLDRDKNEDKMLRVIEIEYVKFPWWKFWKKRKYVEEYHLEVM